MLRQAFEEKGIQAQTMALWELPGYKFFLKTECCRS
jgi:hypothetical protein